MVKKPLRVAVVALVTAVVACNSILGIEQGERLPDHAGGATGSTGAITGSSSGGSDGSAGDDGSGSGGDSSSGAGGNISGAGGTSGTSGSGGASGSGGSGGASGSLMPIPSMGCDQEPPAGQVFGDYSPYALGVPGNGLGTTTFPEHSRSYYVWLPEDYDASKPYRVTFLYSDCGSRDGGKTDTYPLMNEDPDSIYVALNVPPDTITPTPCYHLPSTETSPLDSTEYEFFALVAEEVEESFCVDQNRLYVAGYGSGARVANLLSCYFGGVDYDRKFRPGPGVRGSMTVAAGIPYNFEGMLHTPACAPGPVAGLWIHDPNQADTAGAIFGSELARDRVLEVNDCVGSSTEAWGSAPLSDICVEYVDCPDTYPVVFCETPDVSGDQADTAMPAMITFENLMGSP